MTASLGTEGVSVTFGATRALDGVTFGVAAGEIAGLVGENGAGKTTLLRVLAGFLAPDAGEVRIDGAPVRLRGPRDAALRGIGLVHQQHLLVPEMTVAENVVLGREPGAGPWLDARAAAADVRACAERFGLALDPSARVADLGVAERQRVELAKVLVRGARVLLLDEPTGMLPPSGVRELFALLRRLAGEGCAVVLVTHRLREVRAVCGRATVLRGGRVVGEGAVAATGEAGLARWMVGEEVARGGRDEARGEMRGEMRGEAAAGAPLLVVEGLTVPRDGGAAARPLVDGVSLTLRAGEVVGLAGVAGNGQVELIEAIAGVRRATARTLSLAGRDLRRDDVGARRAAGVAFVPEDRDRDGLVPDLSVAENVALPALGAFASGAFGVLDRDAIRRAGADAVRDHDVRPPDPDAPAGALSGGNRQKVLVARELRSARRARTSNSVPGSVLLVAEPARGLDFRATAAVRRALRDVADAGGAVLVASTDLAELLAVSDRIVVMCGGVVTGEADPRTTTEDALGLLMAGAAKGTAP